VGALLALGSALAYGLSDFFGGLLSRRTAFLRVALLGQIGGLSLMAVVAPLATSQTPQTVDLGWGALSGVGTGVAMVFLFRGISRGAMSIVVPATAVGGVMLPILVGVAVLDERPALQAWAGIAIALPCLWAVSRGGAGSSGAPGLGDGLLSSIGAGLQYLALAQAGSGSGLWPVFSGRVTAVLTIAGVAAAIGLGSAPAGSQRRAVRQPRIGLAAGAVGALAALALVCYLLATRTELISVAVVLSSLYPVIPVVLGLTVLHERLGLGQSVGLVGLLGATVLIATA